MEFELSSASGLSRTLCIGLPSDFTFVVNGEPVYQCSKFQASFVSPAIYHHFIVDPTTTNFALNIESEDGAADFEPLKRLIEGEKIQIDHKNVTFLAEAFKKLGIDEFYQKGFNNLSKINTENVVFQLIERKLNADRYDDLVNFICDNIKDMKSDDLMELDDESLFEIFSVLQDENKNELSEDDKYFIIKKLGTKSLFLMELVELSKLSDSAMNDFFSSIEFESLSKKLFSKIKQTLSKSTIVNSDMEKKQQNNSNNNSNNNAQNQEQNQLERELLVRNNVVVENHQNQGHHNHRHQNNQQNNHNNNVNVSELRLNQRIGVMSIAFPHSRFGSII